MMANYLPVCLEPAIRIWLTSLPERSITSWGDLNKNFIERFQASCIRLGNHFNLTQIKQKADEPLCNYIKRFCAKKTKIPNVLDHQIIVAFKVGVQSDELVWKIGRRNHDLKLTTQECFEIANKLASRESALYDIRGKGKGKHSDKLESSKKDKKWKTENMVAVVDQPKKKPSDKFVDHGQLAKWPCLWHPKGNHKAKDCYTLKGFVTAALKVAKDPPRRNGKDKPNDDNDKDEDGEFKEHRKEVNFIFGG
ncbi:hypothetical protein PR202_gb05728 [Eleusine coracana subsp. coracana]|uniref:Retrotransposon gag domain-containing protein n=1 Tax=Eleusine coracana subsp. coracana TaxID=191504 RepID=A0AAV5E8P3_ELECO|nr:hypothetical protein PR202_gb05728 [Eleusine coracana subsp. coracana]